jgi:short-subunit dehydrogenase
VSRLTGKVAVVTGASSGIGEATARALAAAGAAVVLAARRQERLAAIGEDLERRGAAVSWSPCDVTRIEDLEALREHVTAEHGRCDALVNNAGVPGGGRFADLSIDRIRAVTETNFIAVLEAVKVFLPMLIESRGHIVNVASLAGRYALPGAAVYAASKHAVVAFSESLYDVRAQGVRVTAVCPGFVQTEGFRHVRPPRLFTISAERVAERIVRVLREGHSGTVYVPAWAGPLAALPLLFPGLSRFVAERVAARYWSRQPAEEGGDDADGSGLGREEGAPHSP